MVAVILFLILVLCNRAGISVVTSLNDEGLALLSFKKLIREDPQGSLANWNYSDLTPCSWSGITCKQQRVVSLSIPNKKLSGSLSSSLGSLSYLRHLNLRSNGFVGVLPSELFKAQSLQSLVLFENALAGPLPFEVGNLRNLQTLDLSRNLFNGSLPESLIQCKRLRNLELSHNNFTGSLPNGFGKNLILLERLDLSYNVFTGSIPSDLGYLSSLQGTVDLSHNMFSGSIPSSLGNLPEKVYIDLAYNNLTGPIPQNGALVNRGPTAFIGNTGLCGPPLKNLCSSSSSEANPPSLFPFLPNNYGENVGGISGGGGLSKASVIAIVVCDVIGIIVIGLLFSYCYSRISSSCRKRNDKNAHKRMRECLCFRKDQESGTLSQNVEEYDLVALDGELSFDLDELLKASAFVLGKSGNGIVYKVVLDDGLTLAVRRLGEGGSQRFGEFQTEVQAIGKVRHRNIVMLRAYYWSVDEKLLIYDFIPNGNLATAIHGKSGMVTYRSLPWSIRLKIMKGVAKGLVYLHEYSPKKYIHGDLKPSNILLDHEMEPKISDFGLARLANIAGGSHSDIIASSEATTFPSASSCSSYYRAPEAIVKIAKPSQKWDVYSYGIILLELLSGRLPSVHVGSSGMNIVKWMQLSIEEKRPLCDILDPNLVQDGGDRDEEMIIAVLKIAMACVQTSPDRRPSMRHVYDALLKLPFLYD